MALLWTVFYRTILFYAALVFVMRLMGKREMGALSPVDVAVTVMMAELATFPIVEPHIPIWVGLASVATLAALEVAVAYVCLWSERARGLICGRPSVIIRDGRLVEGEMRRLRYNLHDLTEHLRQKGYPNVEDVEVAILETNGDLSVIPKSQRRPLTPADLGLSTAYEGLPLLLITDGKVQDRALAAAGLDRAWLDRELAARGIRSPCDVFFASLDTQGRLFVQEKERSRAGRRPLGPGPA